MWRIKIQLQVKLPMNEDERGDAFRGIPKLRLLVLEYYLGVPWASPILGSCHSLFHSPSNLHPKLENFNHTKLNKIFVRSVSIRKQTTTISTVANLFLSFFALYLLYSNFSMAKTLQSEPQNHQNKHTTQRKQNLPKTEQSVAIWIFRIFM